jgi:histidinol-phosphate aminotransferase
MERLELDQKAELLKRGFTRRSFGRIATILTAVTTLPFYNEAALAQRATSRRSGFEIPPDAVRINGNENPAGPCPEAADAIHSVIQNGGRYGFTEAFQFSQSAADIESVKQDHVMVFAGSSDPLHRTVMAFCSPGKSFVMGDPGYEAGRGAAQFLGAKVFEVPLTKTYGHDVRAMVKADPNAGLIYICNPNNPTGTLTPREDIEWALANKPAGSILLVDEAYIHISQSWEHRCSDLVAADKDIIILRTFSKLYGMAGLRAGFALARPDLLSKLQGYGVGMLPVTGMVGAAASLRVKNLVPERRKLMKDIREDVFSFLDQHKLTYVKSDSNCFMLDVKRPPQEFMKAMAAEKVFVGRSWPSWPTHARITVGSWDDMKKFKTAVAKVMA